MVITDLEILQLLVKAKELGISQMEVATYKAQTKPIEPEVMSEQEQKDMIKALTEVDMPDDQEILYWATPYYDQLQAEKELKTKSKEGIN